MQAVCKQCSVEKGFDTQLLPVTIALYDQPGVRFHCFVWLNHQEPLRLRLHDAPTDAELGLLTWQLGPLAASQ